MAFRVMHRPESDSPPFYDFLSSLRFQYFFISIATQNTALLKLRQVFLHLSLPSHQLVPHLSRLYVPGIFRLHPSLADIPRFSDSFPLSQIRCQPIPSSIQSHKFGLLTPPPPPPPHTHTPSSSVDLSSFRQSFKQDGRSRINSGLLMVEYVRK